MLRVLYITDIFGQTPVFDEFVASVGGTQHLAVVSPFNQTGEYYKTEAQAYQAFLHDGGVDAYAYKIAAAIDRYPQLTHLIGFSAGASALYKVLSQQKREKGLSTTLFYPSQIRHFVDLTPTHACDIIFPAFESHFDVQTLISNMSGRPNVRIQQVAYSHGFMNQYSEQFNERAYQHYLCYIQQRLAAVMPNE
jgi:hypothetical protein